MQRESSVYEGVADVGVLVPSCFDNPLKEDSINFIQDVLLTKSKVLLPISVVIGAYHVATNYLGVPRLSAKGVLSELLRTGSEALYPLMGADVASNALEYAAMLRIESWDGYLVELARKFGAKVIFSLDEELGDTLKQQKETGFPAVVNPFPSRKVREYHRFLGKKT